VHPLSHSAVANMRPRSSKVTDASTRER